MREFRALRTIMIACGLLFLLGPVLYLLFMPDAFKWAPFSRPYEHLIVAIYGALGICLLMGSKDPLSNSIIIDFTILSSIFAGIALTYNALARTGEIIHLFIDIPLFYLTAIVLILLYPRKLSPKTELQAQSRERRA